MAWAFSVEYSNHYQGHQYQSWLVISSCVIGWKQSAWFFYIRIVVQGKNRLLPKYMNPFTKSDSYVDRGVYTDLAISSSVWVFFVAVLFWWEWVFAGVSCRTSVSLVASGNASSVCWKYIPGFVAIHFGNWRKLWENFENQYSNTLLFSKWLVK